MIRLKGKDMRQRLERVLADNGHPKAKLVNGKHINGKIKNRSEGK
jgi:hypothetical protein